MPVERVPLGQVPVMLRSEVPTTPKLTDPVPALVHRRIAAIAPVTAANLETYMSIRTFGILVCILLWKSETRNSKYQAAWVTVAIISGREGAAGEGVGHAQLSSHTKCPESCFEKVNSHANPSTYSSY